MIHKRYESDPSFFYITDHLIAKRFEIKIYFRIEKQGYNLNAYCESNMLV